jgi:hypothetical protein
LQVLIAAGLISISDANAGQFAFDISIVVSAGNPEAMTIAASRIREVTAHTDIGDIPHPSKKCGQ